MPTDYAELEIGLHYRDEASYGVELRFSMPDSDADIRPPEQAPLVEFNREKLRALELNAVGYGAQLTRDLFVEPVKVFFAAAKSASQTANKSLRVRLWIDPRASKLHSLRWETLRDPVEDAPLFTDEKLPFARYLSSLDWRPVHLRPQGDLRALLVVANPTDLFGKFNLNTVDVAGELDRARESLGVMRRIDELPADGQRATLNHLLAKLRDGYDVVYLVCHGSFHEDTNRPYLWLEKDDGTADQVEGGELVAQLRALAAPLPRLVVLASCESAGEGEGDVLMALGPRLAEAGVPAVLAQQGKLRMDLASEFMPAFFRELQRDGQIDRAMSAARGHVWRKYTEWWMPTLFMRLKSGRLWYVPDFAAVAEDVDQWEGLLSYIRADPAQCTPILGPGLLDAVIGPRRDLAERWAQDYGYPLAPHERDALPSVAQFVAVKRGAMFPRNELRAFLEKQLRERYAPALGAETLKELPLPQLLAAVGAHLRAQNPASPHRALARLPLPIFINASPDSLLVDALTAEGKSPRVQICQWRRHNEPIKIPPQSGDDPAYQPTPEAPLVYYLFGSLQYPQSVVLTEDDYFDYLISVNRVKSSASAGDASASRPNSLPLAVGDALASTALLFLGFQVSDWDFRVIYRTIYNQNGSGQLRDFTHVAAQIYPEEGRLLEPRLARTHFEKYFQPEKTSIFWGSVEDFAVELNKRWPAA